MATLSLFDAASNGLVEKIREVLEGGAHVDMKNADRKTPLYIASEKGHMEAVRVLLEGGASVDMEDKDGRTPLFVASLNGHAGAVRVLLDGGASVDTANKEGGTPLGAASWKGHTEVVKVLLEGGALVNKANWQGRTPLYAASWDGRTEAVKVLLEGGASVDMADEDDRTPLHIASWKGHMEVVRVLLEGGAAVDTADKYGRTPLGAASRSAYTEAVRVLLEAGADPVRCSWSPLWLASCFGETDKVNALLEGGASVDVADNEGGTPLYIASWNGRTEAVKLLLEGRALVDMADKDGWAPLHVASENGHIEVVKVLLEGGASVNKAAGFGRTPLCLASEEGHAEVVRVLLERGASVNKADKDGWTPVYVASLEGHAEVVRVLLERGASVNKADKDGWTPVYVASLEGHAEVVKVLLEGGASVDAADKNGWTPVYVASENGHTETMKVLMEAGASVNKANKDGGTPLHAACWKGRMEAVKVLLEGGVSVDMADKDGRTPLYAASWDGDMEAVRVLLEGGASVNKASKDGRTPLSNACSDGHTEVVRMLLEGGASVDTADKIGQTPLIVASRYGRMEAVRMLLEAGASVDTANVNGWTPLHVASENGHTEVIKVLLEAGESVDTVDKKGQTPLFVASWNGRTEAVKVLMERGASVDMADMYGETPLLIASWNGHTEAVTVLLEGGASVDMADMYGRTPLFVASLNGRTEAVKVLLEAGVSIDMVNKDGCTPLYVASLNGRTEAVKVLLEGGASVDMADKDAKTPVQVTAGEGHALASLLLCFFGAAVAGVRAKGIAKDVVVAAREPHILAVLRDPADGSVAPNLNAFLHHNGPAPPDQVAVSELQALVLRFAPNLRVKIILAGCKEQGKTSFLNALQGRKAAQPAGEDGRTQGMTITSLRDVPRTDDTGALLPPCTVRVFDFGGHDEYWSVQSSFLTGQCVVVLVVSLAAAVGDADGTAHRLRLWLDAVLSRATESVTVVLLGTHLDCVDKASEVLEDFVGVYCDHCLYRGGVAQPAVVAGVSSKTRRAVVRCEDGTYTDVGPGGLFGGQSGVEAVLESILRAASSQLSGVLGAPIPSSWAHVVDMFEAGSVACDAVFGGQWLVPWSSFCERVGPLIRWDGEMSVVATLAEHLVHTGVAVACRSSAQVASEAAGGGVETDAAPEWKRQPECVGCGARFARSLLAKAVGTRQHHCRGCGNAFCDSCAPIRKEHSMRLCTTCHTFRKLQTASSAAPSAPRAAPPPPAAGAGAAASPAVASLAPGPAATADAPQALVIDMQRLVDAMKSVVSHSYAGVKYHDVKTASVLSGAAAEELVGDKEVFRKRHRNMTAVAAAVQSGGVYASLEAVHADERLFVEKGRVRRRFLYNVLWHAERLVDGRKLYALVADSDKDRLVELLCKYEHAVLTEREAGDRLQDMYLLPYLPSIKGVDVRGGGAVTTVSVRRPIPASSASIGAVLRHRYDLQYFPADLFGQLVVKAYGCPVGSVHQCWGSTIWLQGEESVREGVMILENVMLWHARAGRYVAAGASSAVTSRLAFGGAGELHVMGWYDCAAAGGNEAVAAEVRSEICSGGGVWRSRYRKIQVWAEAMCRRRIDEYGALVRRDVYEVDGYDAEVPMEAVEVHVAGRGWLNIMKVESVDAGVMPLHLAAPGDPLEPPDGWRCACTLETAARAGAGEAPPEPPAPVEAWHPPPAMVNTNTGMLQALHWEHASLGEAVPDHGHVRLFDVAPGGAEFVAVESMLLAGVVGSEAPPSVVRVQRVQNDPLWMRYFGEWQQLRNVGVAPNERLMWHGTSGLPPLEVYRGQDVGFDMRFAGMNESKWATLAPEALKDIMTSLAPAYGKGLYFADKAGYSVWKYAHRTTDDSGRTVHQLVLARVLTGHSFEYGDGKERKLVRPPEREPGKLYDSVCGGPHRNVGAPEWASSRMYVVSYTT